MALVLLFCQTVRQKNNFGNDVIDVDRLKQEYLETIALSKYSYGDVEMTLGQDVFIQPAHWSILNPTEKYSNCCLITVGMGFEWSIALDFGTRLDMLDMLQCRCAK